MRHAIDKETEEPTKQTIISFMKKYFTYMAACLVALCMASCGNSKEGASKEATKKETVKKAPAKKATKKKILMPNASGLPYEMLVVMDDAQWERPVGRALFNVLDTDALPFRRGRSRPSAAPHGQYAPRQKNPGHRWFCS